MFIDACVEFSFDVVVFIARTVDFNRVPTTVLNGCGSFASGAMRT